MNYDAAVIDELIAALIPELRALCWSYVDRWWQGPLNVVVPGTQLSRQTKVCLQRGYAVRYSALHLSCTNAACNVSYLFSLR